MTAARKAIAVVAGMAAVAVDVLGLWMATTGMAVAGAIPPAGTNGIVTAVAAAGLARITAAGRTDQLNPLASKRRRKSN